MIVVIGGEKGGTGKTTLATNLATLRAKRGKDVLLIDTDKQGSASAWCIFRANYNIEPRIPNVQVFGKNLNESALDLHSRYEDIIIDAGGRDSVELRSAISVADVLYIPVQASQFDIWTLSIMNDAVKQAKPMNKTLIARVIINRATTNPSVNEVEEAKEVLSDFDELDLSKCTIKDRISYRKAAKRGIGIVELDKRDLKAEAELIDLYKEIYTNE